MPDPSQNNPNSPNRNNGDPQGKKPATPPGNRFSRGLFGWVMVFVLVAMLVLIFQNVSGQVETLGGWDEFKNLYVQGEIKDGTVELHDREITAVRNQGVDGPQRQVRLTIDPKIKDKYAEWLNDLTGGKFKDAGGPPLWQLILFNPLLITILLIVIIWVVILRGLRGAGGGAGMLGNFGRSKHRVFHKEMTNITFQDVAGIEEAKDEVDEIIQFLKNPKKFTRLGARIPRGVLLVGPPGTGKTLLAKAIAGEADVPFFSISGSDFVEMFVGVGASRVRDLFKTAKESSPCIIFLDEIDAVGRKRGAGFSSGGHDEREQTLNAILVEMDGFETSDQVIVIAATNRVDVLDPALTRPGRFDREVIVPLPDVKGRLQILRVHANKVKLGPNVDLERIARGTPMFSGAELAAIINESAIIATLADKDFIEQADLEEARDKVKFGRQRKSRVVEEEERVATAYHEAGHAVLQVLLEHADPLHKVTIIPRGETGGASMTLPVKERYTYGVKWLHAMMRVACGGRIAEEIKTGDVSSGASMDIQQVTRIARAMILEWGMSEKLGFVRYAEADGQERYTSDREYSEETARLVDDEVRRIIDEAYAEAKSLLKEHWDQVERVAQALLKHETLNADEVEKLMRGEELSKPTVGDLLAAEAKKLAPDQKGLIKPKPKTDDDTPPGLMPSPA